jgi:ribonuclease-3 family protein
MKPEQYSPLTLAYLGDAVFELLVREKLVAAEDTSVYRFHQQAKAYVSATAQNKAYFHVFDKLTSDEQRIMLRGRNAKTHRRLKGTRIVEYQHATGLETLFGYLYVAGKMERIKEIFAMCSPTEEKTCETERY